MVILSLDEAVSADAAGSKAASLGRMRRAGLAVPDGVVVMPPQAEVSLDQLCEAMRGGGDWRREAVALRARLSTVAVPQAVRAAAERLRPPLAVRSSALVEDSTDASFAGLFTTLLGVRPDELENAVRSVWAARFSDTVIRYAIGCGVDLRKTEMAVIVQEVIDARSAGSAVSMDSNGLIGISGAWGLGRSVMDGQVAPDSWRVDRQTFTVLDQCVGSKPIAAYLDPDGGEVWRKQSPRLINAPSVKPEEVVRLARLALGAECALGAPQEVEWAIDDAGRVWLLQSRRISPAIARVVDVDLDWLNVARVVEGRPASPGQVVGHATRLDKPGLGDILVARTIPPGTMALLLHIGGLVVESGGSTAHAATLARERSIPAVFGAVRATQLIPAGALVLVDGTRGQAWYQSQRG